MQKGKGKTATFFQKAHRPKAIIQYSVNDNLIKQTKQNKVYLTANTHQSHRQKKLNNQQL